MGSHLSVCYLFHLINALKVIEERFNPYMWCFYEKKNQFTEVAQNMIMYMFFLFVGPHKTVEPNSKNKSVHLHHPTMISVSAGWW